MVYRALLAAKRAEPDSGESSSASEPPDWEPLHPGASTIHALLLLPRETCELLELFGIALGAHTHEQSRDGR